MISFIHGICHTHKNRVKWWLPRIGGGGQGTLPDLSSKTPSGLAVWRLDCRSTRAEAGRTFKR